MKEPKFQELQKEVTCEVCLKKTAYIATDKFLENEKVCAPCYKRLLKESLL